MLQNAQSRYDALVSRGSGRLLAIETSCDETAAAVVENGRVVLSNVVHTQIPLHQVYGGVVPEIASRSHVEMIGPVVDRALSEAGVTLDALDGIAVTGNISAATAFGSNHARSGARRAEFIRLKSRFVSKA